MPPSQKKPLELSKWWSVPSKFRLKVADLKKLKVGESIEIVALDRNLGECVSSLLGQKGRISAALRADLVNKDKGVKPSAVLQYADYCVKFTRTDARYPLKGKIKPSRRGGSAIDPDDEIEFQILLPKPFDIYMPLTDGKVDTVKQKKNGKWYIMYDDWDLCKTYEKEFPSNLVRWDGAGFGGGSAVVGIRGPVLRFSDVDKLPNFYLAECDSDFDDDVSADSGGDDAGSGSTATASRSKTSKKKAKVTSATSMKKKKGSAKKTASVMKKGAKSAMKKGAKSAV